MHACLCGQISSEEIAFALDGDVGVEWVVEAGDRVVLDVVEKEGAKHGSALKITVPGDQELRLRRELIGDHVVDFQISMESEYGGGLYVLSDQNLDRDLLLIEEGQDGVWSQLTVGYEQTDDFHFGWYVQNVGAELAERIFYLDGVELDPGFLVTTDGIGIDYEIVPEKHAYLESELVTLKVLPESENNVFLYWEDESQVRYSSMELDVEITQSRGFTAYGGMRFELEGCVLIVPAATVLAEVRSIGDEPLVLGLESSEAQSVSSSVVLKSQGPGFLSFKARIGVDNHYGTPSLDSVDLSGDFERRSYWIGPGDVEFDLELLGAIEIGDFQFEAGYPVSVQVKGEGEVEGVPVRGSASPGDIVTLTAIPDDGWTFYGWSGPFESESSVLEIQVDRVLDFEAEFVRPRTIGGIEVILSGSGAWTSLGQGESELLYLEDLIPAGEESRSEWTFNGPGFLNLEYGSLKGSGTIRLDGVEVVRFEPVSYWDAPILLPEYLGLEFGIGEHVLEVELNTSEVVGTEFNFNIGSVKYRRGVEVLVTATEGGDVRGVPEQSRVSQGTDLNLEAVADSGYRFLKWSGSFTSDTSSLLFSAERATNLEAIFVKIPAEETVEGDAYVSQLVGHSHWRKVDGLWESPETLNEVEFARLEGTVRGPGRLLIEFEDIGSSNDGDYTVLIDGEPTRSIFFNRYNFPEGVHEFSIQASPGTNGGYSPRKISKFQVEYAVSIAVLNAGLVSTNQLIEQRPRSTNPWADPIEQPVIWYGWIADGTEFSFDVIPESGMVFDRWVGDLEGESLNGNIVVTGPITSKAISVFPYFETNGIRWDIMNAEGLSPDPLDEKGFVMNGSTDSVTLSTEISDGGLLSVFASGYGVMELTIDGEIVSRPSGLFGPDVIWKLFSEEEHTVSVNINAYDIEPNLFGYSGLVSYQFNFHPGVVLNRDFSVGGSVVIDPSKGSYVKGENVTITAEAHDGNVFVGWSPLLDQYDETFSIEAEEHMDVYAIFAALDDVAGYDWIFEGVRPTYRSNSGNGTLQWDFDRNVDVGTAKASIKIEGPGLLDIPPSSESQGGYVRCVISIDGELIEPGPDSASGIELEIGAGEHVVTWLVEFEAPDPKDVVGVSWTSYCRMHIPTFKKEFVVNATGKDSEVGFSVERDMYLFGEMLTLTAPKNNNSGELFNGWWTRPNHAGKLLSLDRVWEFSVEKDFDVYANYKSSSLSISEASVVDYYISRFNIDEEVLTPRGNASYQSDENTVFGISVPIPSVVSFSVLVSGNASSYAKVSRNGGDDFGLVRSSSQWMRYSVFLDAGDSLRFECYGNSRSVVRIGDFEVVDGWGPTLVYPENIKLDFMYSNDGTSVLVTLADDQVASFDRWRFNDGRSSHESEYKVDVGSLNDARLFVRSEIATPFGDITLIPSDSWGYQSYSGLEDGGLSWRSTLGYDGAGFNSLGMKVEGPKVVSYTVKRESGQSSVYVSIDGQVAKTSQTGYSYYTGEERQFNVPSGEHVVLFTHVDPAEGEIVVANFKIDEGLFLESRAQEGGELVLFPEKEWYDLGERVSIIAVPNEGYSFVDWERPFEGEQRRLTRIVEGGLQLPVPIFEQKTQRSVSALRLDWELEGMTLESESVRMEELVIPHFVRKHVAGVSSWMKATVSGPSVMRLGQEIEWSRVTIDGKPILDRSLTLSLREGGILDVGIPAGEHLVQLDFPRDAPDANLSDGFSLFPGFLVAPNVSGAAFRVSPEYDVYPPGTEVSVEILEVTDSSRIEWDQLPSGSIAEQNRATFIVADHTALEAYVWKNAHLLNRTIQHAGNREWIEEDSRVKRNGFTAGDMDLLEISGLAAGLLRIKMNAPSSANGRFSYKVSLNGVNVSIATREGSEFIEAYVTINNTEDVVRWIIEEISFDPNGTDSSIEIIELSLVPIGTESLYMSWWNGYSQDGVLDRSLIDSKLDIGGDGLSNYLEYLLGRDPWSTEPALEVRISNRTNILELKSPMIPDEMASDFYLESRAGGRLWLDATFELGDSRGHSLYPDSTFRDLLSVPSEGEAVLFRLRLNTYIPSTDSLLEK